MILILSQNGLEASTDLVQDWIHWLGGDFVRLNGEDLLAGEEFSLEIGAESRKLELKVGGRSFDASQVGAAWFRRWTTPQTFEFLETIDDRRLTRDMREHLVDELRSVSRALHFFLKDAKWLTHPRELAINKLEVLYRAAEVGLDIPETLVTNDKDQLTAFWQRHHGRIIVKAAERVTNLIYRDMSYPMFTAELSADDLHALPAHFFPSLVQARVDKEYEIRTFFLAGRCWSMAIFSQADSQTRLDFRRYNLQKPNRFVPFSLPAEVERKLIALMDAVGLTTGSLDLMKSPEGKYVFLEINPAGQFGMTSRPCNYRLEKQVAEHLIALDGAHD